MMLHAQKKPAVVKAKPLNDTVQDTIGPEKSINTVRPFVETAKETQSDSIDIDSTGIGNTTRPNSVISNIAIKESGDAIPAPITYGSRDTNWVEIEESKIHLYGEAYVNFENYEIKAGYIIFDFANSIAYAEGRPDKSGKIIEAPTFNDGTQTFTYKKLKYNFKTKKGLVYDAVATEGELFILGAKTKFISAESDTLVHSDHICNENALITSCNHPEPHFGIRTTKLKIIPDKLAIMGPANLEIAGVKTPIWLPFGFFPIAAGVASSGLIFPNDYEYSQQLGFGFREIGYYFPINDHVDLRLTGDIYTRGTFGIRLASNYKKRYGYNGNLRLGFSNRRLENSETGNKDSKKAYSITLTHNQDSKAHPYRKIGGTINISTNDYRSDNFNDATSVLQSVYRSNFNWSHSLPSTPFSMRLGLSHDQNTETGVVNMTLPDFKINMNTIYPFKQKNKGGNKESWYEKINVKYDGAAKAYVRTQDSILFTAEVLEDIQYGISHKANASASFRALKYFNVVPNVSYDEIWFFRTLDKRINDQDIEIDSFIQDITIEGDTIYSTPDTTYLVQDEIINNFDQYRNLNVSVTASTQLFRTIPINKGFLRGIRHVAKPSVSFRYNPSTRDRYQEILYTDPNDPLDSLLYNPFAGGVFGTPSLSAEALSINYSIINIFEGKYFSKKDSTTKKFKFFDNITVSGNYNFAADSLKWSQVGVRGNTKLIKGLTNFQFTAVFDPYLRNSKGESIQQTVWADRKRPLAFNTFMGTFSTRLRFKQIRDLFRGKEVKEEENGVGDQSSTQLGARFDENPNGTRFDPNLDSEDISGFGPETELEDKAGGDQLESEGKEDPKLPHILDLLDNFSMNHTYNFVLQRQTTGVDSFYTRTNSLSLSGKFDLTDNWSVNLDRISYDFKNKSLVYPSLRLSRDLHCWSMDFSWAPQRGVYSFFIGVKANTFDFMKYNYGQNAIDGFR